MTLNVKLMKMFHLKMYKEICKKCFNFEDFVAIINIIKEIVKKNEKEERSE